MIKKMISIFMFFILLYLPNFVQAKQSEEFFDFLSDKIYRDCIGEELIVKENSLLDISKEPFELKHLKQNNIPWIFLNKDTIKEFLYIFSTREPFHNFIIIGEEKKLTGIIPTFIFTTSIGGTEKEIKIPNDGTNLLRCGNKSLDINGIEYYWGNKKVELPNKFNNNYTSYVLPKIELNIFSFSILGISGISISFLIIRKKDK